jgi:hypothetical protein
MRCATTNNSDFGHDPGFRPEKSRRGEFGWTKRNLKMQRTICTHSYIVKQGLRAWHLGCACGLRAVARARREAKTRPKIRIDTRIGHQDHARFTDTISPRLAPKKSHKIRDSIAGSARCWHWCGRASEERGEGEEGDHVERWGTATTRDQRGRRASLARRWRGAHD